MNMGRLMGMAAALVGTFHVPALGAEQDVIGTYRLITVERKAVDTGSIEREPHPQGFTTYGPEGRMVVLILRGMRPKPESVDKITDQQRADLFRTMTAYSGTYTIDGTSIVHNIDLSWNEAWTGTKQVRYFKKQGDKLELSTPPYRFSGDGRMITNTLVWEKIK